MNQHPDLDFYARPAGYTAVGRHWRALTVLPDDVASLARVVPGLLLHRFWAEAKGIELAPERAAEIHMRSVEAMLDRLLAHDARPFDAARPAGARIVGVCRHFALLLGAMLRLKGVAARARCGFVAYFFAGRFEDHWVCEYWNAIEERWVLVDAQLDDGQRRMLRPDFDPLDVPRDRFLVAGEALARCRAGAAKPSAFGLFDMRGLWFVAGNLVRDLAALNNREMLPWDVWGAMPQPEEPLGNARLALFDRIATLTREPPRQLPALRALYDGESGLAVPTTVFNAQLRRAETS